MTAREKLIDLLGADTCGYDCVACEHNGNEDACIRHLKESMADHLLANGIVVLPRKWSYGGVLRIEGKDVTSFV